MKKIIVLLPLLGLTLAGCANDPYYTSYSVPVPDGVPVSASVSTRIATDGVKISPHVSLNPQLILKK